MKQQTSQNQRTEKGIRLWGSYGEYSSYYS